MRRLACSLALVASGCQFYTLENECGPGFDGGECVIPGPAGASGTSGSAGTSGGISSGSAGATTGGEGASSSSSTGTSAGGSSSGGVTSSGGSSTGSSAAGNSSGGVSCPSGWTAAVVTQNSAIEGPEALAYAGGQLYLADSQAKAIFSINPATGSFSSINGNAESEPTSLAAVDGGLLVGNSGSDLYLVSLPSQSATDLVTDPEDDFFFAGLAVNAAGLTYFINTEADTGCFFGFDYLEGPANPTEYGPASCNSPFHNGSAASAGFELQEGPQALAFDPTGTLLYVADQGDDMIRSIDLDAGTVATLAGSSTTATTDMDGPALRATLVSPVGLAVDAAGDVFVIEAAGVVREITAGSSPMVETLYDQSCSFDAIGTDSPVGIAVTPSGQTIYVSDAESLAVWSLTSSQ